MATDFGFVPDPVDHDLGFIPDTTSVPVVPKAKKKPTFREVLGVAGQKAGAFAGDVAQSVGESVVQAVTHPVETAKNIVVETGKDIAAIPGALQTVVEPGRIAALVALKTNAADSPAGKEAAAELDRLVRAGALSASVVVGGLAAGPAKIGLSAIGKIAAGARAGAAGMGTYSAVKAAGSGAPLEEVAKETAVGSILGGAAGAAGGAIHAGIKGRGVSAPKAAPVEVVAPKVEALAAPVAEASVPRVRFSDALAEQIQARGVDPDALFASLRKDTQDAVFDRAAKKFSSEELASLEQIARTEVAAPAPIVAPSPVPVPVEPAASLASPLQRQPIPQGPMVARLPQELAGAKPRYGFGAKQFVIAFKDDIDKATYIVSQAKKSARDAEYLQWLHAQGFTNEQIAVRGAAVKASIKDMAKASDPKAGPLTVASHEPVAPVAPPAEQQAPVMSRQSGGPVSPAAVPEGAPVPFKPTSRTGTVSEAHQEVVRKIEASPEYRDMLNESGGGRRVANVDTWAKAAEAPPLSIEELGAWEPGARVNEVDVARARILRQATLDDFDKAMSSGDEALARVASGNLIAVETGFNNLTAIPGRALQMEGALLPGEVKQVADYAGRVARLTKSMTDANIPFEQQKVKVAELKKVIEAIEKKAKKDQGIEGILSHIDNWSVPAKLMSVSTQVTNAISNLANTVGMRGPQRVIGSQVLKAMGMKVEGEAMARNAVWAESQGFRNAQEVASGEFMTALKGEKSRSLPVEWIESTEGKKAWRDTYGKDAPPPYEFQSIAPERFHKRLQFLYRGAQKTTRLMEAADKYFKAVVYHSEINQRALAQALSEKLEGAALDARVKGLIEQPLPEWKVEAWQKALEVTFQENPGTVVNIVAEFQRIPLMRTLLLPFLKTVSNIARAGVRSTPEGVLYGLVNPKSYFGKALRAGGVRRAEALAQMTWGTTVFMGTASIFWNSDFTTARPRNPKDAAEWDAKGLQPWTIYRPGQSRGLNYSKWGPASVVLMHAAVAVQMVKDANDPEKAQKAAAKGMANLLQGPLDMPYMQSMDETLRLFNNPESWPTKGMQAVGQRVAGLIPSTVRDVRQQVDEKKRQTQGLVEVVADMLPGASQALPARETSVGQEMKLDPNRLVRLLKWGSVRSSDDLAKMIEESGYAPSQPGSTLTYKGKTVGHGERKVTLKGDDLQAFQHDMRLAAAAGMLHVRTRSEYDKLSKDDRARRFMRSVEGRQGQMRDLYEKKHGLRGSPMDEARFNKARASILNLKAPAPVPEDLGFVPDNMGFVPDEK